MSNTVQEVNTCEPLAENMPLADFQKIKNMRKMKVLFSKRQIKSRTF